jgi:hypothetical protein
MLATKVLAPRCYSFLFCYLLLSDSFFHGPVDLPFNDIVCSALLRDNHKMRPKLPVLSTSFCFISWALAQPNFEIASARDADSNECHFVWNRLSVRFIPAFTGFVSRPSSTFPDPFVDINRPSLIFRNLAICAILWISFPIFFDLQRTFSQPAWLTSTRSSYTCVDLAAHSIHAISVIRLPDFIKSRQSWSEISARLPFTAKVPMDEQNSGRESPQACFQSVRIKEIEWGKRDKN